MSGYRDTTVMTIGKIEVVETTFDDAPEYNTIALEWVEPSSDHWHSDNEESVDINKETAVKLIEILKTHFKL